MLVESEIKEVISDHKEFESNWGETNTEKQLVSDVNSSWMLTVMVCEGKTEPWT